MTIFTLSGHDQMAGGYRAGTGLGVVTFPTVGTTAVITPSGASARAAIPAGVDGSGVYRAACDVAVHIAFGNSSIDATTSDAVLTAGEREIHINDATVTHVAVLAV